MSMNPRHSAQNVIAGYGEGRFNSQSETFIPPTQPTFVRMIVIDVITDPNNDNLDQKKASYWSGRGVTNMGLINVLPRNTIVAKAVNEDAKPMFVFPFFPSHLSMPCKPGECVWVMIENPNATNIEIAYWFCKATEIHTSDDINHTHPGRHFEISSFPGIKDKHDSNKGGSSSAEDEAWHELRNAPVKMIKDDRVTVPSNLILRNEPEDIFEYLVTASDASRLMVYESVPRFRKRPGDIALEGSNNTLIVLGTDRKGPAVKYDSPKSEEEKLFKTQVPTYPDTDFKNDAGSIDIVAGRGQVKETYGTSASTTSILNAKGKSKGTEIKKELNKVKLSQGEGDVDYINDRSRILVSQRTKVDENFGLKTYNQDTNPKLKIEDSANGDSGIVIKSDKIRIIARSDVEILVTDYKEEDSPSGIKVKKDGTDAKKWASITIRKNGDIIFKPSEEGYIKLGGDDAQYGIVCTDSPVTAISGSVTGGPILTTAGGSFAGAAPGAGKDTSPIIKGQGKFASKVLIK